MTTRNGITSQSFDTLRASIVSYTKKKKRWPPILFLHSLLQGSTWPSILKPLQHKSNKNIQPKQNCQLEPQEPMPLEFSIQSVCSYRISKLRKYRYANYLINQILKIIAPVFNCWKPLFHDLDEISWQRRILICHFKEKKGVSEQKELLYLNW